MFFDRRNGTIHLKKDEEFQLKKSNKEVKKEMKEKLLSSYGNRISFNNYLDALKVSKGIYSKQQEPKFEHIPTKIDHRWEDNKIKFIRQSPKYGNFVEQNR